MVLFDGSIRRFKVEKAVILDHGVRYELVNPSPSPDDEN